MIPKWRQKKMWWKPKSDKCRYCYCWRYFVVVDRYTANRKNLILDSTKLNRSKLQFDGFCFSLNHGSANVAAAAVVVVAFVETLDHKSLSSALFAFFSLSNRFSRWLCDVSNSSSFSIISRFCGRGRENLQRKTIRINWIGVDSCIWECVREQ